MGSLVENSRRTGVFAAKNRLYGGRTDALPHILWRKSRCFPQEKAKVFHKLLESVWKTHAIIYENLAILCSIDQPAPSRQAAMTPLEALEM